MGSDEFKLPLLGVFKNAHSTTDKSIKSLMPFEQSLYSYDLHNHFNLSLDSTFLFTPTMLEDNPIRYKYWYKREVGAGHKGRRLTFLRREIPGTKERKIGEVN
jgi:hypothetical protein